jgi:glycosyltransferase involved in cell wall biosynthesis
VVEGKSPDGTLTAIQRVSHNWMRLISEPDERIYAALNKRIMHATGDELGFLHSDDFFAHDAVGASTHIPTTLIFWIAVLSRWPADKCYGGIGAALDVQPKQSMEFVIGQTV